MLLGPWASGLGGRSSVMSQADGASHSPEEGLVTQKQFSYIRCVLSQGLCSVLWILDFTSDQLTPISLGHSQRRTASEIIVPQPGIEPWPSSESSESQPPDCQEIPDIPSFITFPEPILHPLPVPSKPGQTLTLHI